MCEVLSTCRCCNGDDYSLNVTADAAGEADRGQSSEATFTHHVLVCALHELGCLVHSLGTSSAPLITEPSAGQLSSV